MIYLGKGHGEDRIAVVVWPENVAFITDVAAPKRLPFRTIPGSSPNDWIKQIEKVESLDFEIFAPAHRNVSVTADIADVITCMETLREKTLADLKNRQSAEQLQASTTMDEYKDWFGYDNWRTENVQGFANHLIKSGAVN